MMDSLVHLRLATVDDVAGWLAVAPKRVRGWLDHLDHAESGIETMARLRLKARGIEVRTQVWLAPGIRVDLLVGDRLVIECDGRQFHDSPEKFEADRARDRTLTALGYIVVRISYRQMLGDWPSVLNDIVRIVREGRHKCPRNRS